ncbi:MAG: hypothetical protein ACHBN1_34160 [Heteroscytonema crispum UTEX LB 1556]
MLHNQNLTDVVSYLKFKPRVWLVEPTHTKAMSQAIFLVLPLPAIALLSNNN